MKLRLPQVFILNVEIDHDYRIFFYDGKVFTKCPICPLSGCVRTHGSSFNLDILDSSGTSYEADAGGIISDDQWFEKASESVSTLKKYMWDAWGTKLFQGNKNIFVVRKNLGDGTSNNRFFGREGYADNPDLRFEKAIRMPEDKYAELVAFW